MLSVMTAQRVVRVGAGLGNSYFERQPLRARNLRARSVMLERGGMHMAGAGLHG